DVLKGPAQYRRTCFTVPGTLKVNDAGWASWVPTPAARMPVPVARVTPAGGPRASVPSAAAGGTTLVTSTAAPTAIPTTNAASRLMSRPRESHVEPAAVG